MTSLILSWISWTGFTRHGRLINISMPSRHVTVHLCCWHPIQIRKIRALRSMFKWFLEGIHSSLPHDIRRLPRDRPLEIQPRHAHIYEKGKKKKRPISKYSAILLTISITNPFSLISYVLMNSQHFSFILWLFSSIWIFVWRNFGFSLFRSHIYCFRTWRTPRMMTFLGWFQPAPQLRRSMALIRISHLMILLRHRTSPGQPEWLQPLRPFTPYLSRSSATPFLPDLMNFGSWKGHWMVLKLGNQWKHFWKTCTSQGIVPPCAPLLTIGASIMIYPSNHPPPLRQHPFRFSHIPNTPTSTFHNRTKRYRTSFTFYNHAGDVRLNIIHKVPLFLCLGHHGDLHHRPHHRQHFTGPYTWITLPHLFIILTVHYLRTNLALWICLTPVCNRPHHFAKRKKKKDWMSTYDHSLCTPFRTSSLSWLSFSSLSYLTVFLFCSLGLTLGTRRHGSLFSPSPISRYIQGWYTTRSQNCCMACWTSRPSWWCGPSSIQTRPDFSGLLSFARIDTPQWTWPWSLHGSCQFKFQEC